VTIPVGESSIVEFVTPVPGRRTAVDHNLSRVYFQGIGQVILVEGVPSAEIYERIERATYDCSDRRHVRP
jgi:hypothetical protein